jgi:hypothetical protein
MLTVVVWGNECFRDARKRLFGYGVEPRRNVSDFDERPGRACRREFRRTPRSVSYEDIWESVMKKLYVGFFLEEYQMSEETREACYLLYQTLEPSDNLRDYYRRTGKICCE